MENKNGGFIMPKIIKRVGIVFFALVISCLLAIGCLLTMNISDSDFGSSVKNTKDNIQTASDYSVTLSSGNQTIKWNEAIQYSLDNGGVNVDVVLTANWTATSSNEYTTSFGEGIGFNNGRIMIPRGATIFLDLNNYSINRNLTAETDDGNVIINYGSLHIKDNSRLGAGTITGGYVNNGANNSAGGGIANMGNATLTLSSGAISNNRAYNSGGGIYNYGLFLMYGGKVTNNEVYGIPRGSSGGGILNASTFIMYDGIISENYCVYVGGGLMNGRNCEIYGGIISNNSALNGAGMRNDGNALIAGGIITENVATGIGGGLLYNIGTVSIKAGAQIYGNKVNPSGNDSDVHFTIHSAQTKLKVLGNLCEDGKTTHIGISGEANNTITFTDGFSQYNGNNNPARYFYSNKVGYNVGTSSGEAIFVNGTTVTETITWRWNGAGQGNTTASNATVQYNASKSYVIDIGGDSFYDEYGNLSNTKSVSEPGNYAFYTTKSCVNPTFMFTIKGGSIEAPKGINKTFTYSGEVIDCSSYINGFNSNKMNILNNKATQAGIYYALVAPKQGFNWLDGSNKVLLYEFVIEPQKINKPTIGNNTFVYSGSEITYVIDYNADLVEVTNFKATDVGKYKAKVSLKDNRNYAWEDGSKNELEYDYEIIHPGIVLKDSSKLDYIYLDNNFRKGYKENKLIHKVNDSEKTTIDSGNIYIIGNIKVNTTLNSFISNIRNDSKLLKVYGAKGELIYDGISCNGLIAESVENYFVGTGFKLELYDSSTYTVPSDTIYLSVLGDINGDGRINASDVSYLRQVANDSTLLESMPLERQLACMINNKGGITEVDSEILRNYIGKEIDLEKFMESETANTNNTYTYLTLDRDNMLRKTSESKTNVIGNISVNTSVEMLKTKLVEMGINISAITIYNRKGDEVSNNTAIVGTGWRIEVGGEVTYLSVLGDLTGDGRITAADISYLRAIAASDTTNVQDCILLSAILLNKGGITTADSEVLKLVINNKISIDKY